MLAYDTSPERSITAIARREGKHFGEVVLDYLLASDLDGYLMIPLFNPDLEVAAELLDHPLTGIGLGDSGAHTTQTCDASYATFILAYWVREKKRLSIERAVRKLSFDPALMWGIRDRGMLRRGFFADLNVIDLDHLDIELPRLRHDFPTGAPHLSQSAIGYEATVVNGQVLMRDGQPTGAMPGVVLKNELVA